MSKRCVVSAWRCPVADIIAFPGPHSDLFADYIRFKRSLGYAIADSYQYVLREIARCIAGRDRDPEIVSAAVAEELTARRPHESTSTQCKRITIVRQFCLWLASTGYSPTIPAQGLVRDTTEFVPRIVSESEMARIITIADRDESHQRRLLLQCCGAAGCASVKPAGWPYLISIPVRARS